MNGTIGKQMVDTLVESTANVEVGTTKLFKNPQNLKKRIIKFARIFLMIQMEETSIIFILKHQSSRKIRLYSYHYRDGFFLLISLYCQERYLHCTYVKLAGVPGVAEVLKTIDKKKS